MSPCTVTHLDDTLTLSTGRVTRRFRWNNGNLVSLELRGNQPGQVWPLAGDQPDLALPGVDAAATDGSLVVVETPAGVTPAHTRAEVTCRFGDLSVKRVFRLYDDCPAIACDVYLRGRWPGEPAAQAAGVMERLAMARPHLRLTCVQFLDWSDRRNNMVRTHTYLPYRYEDRLEGNLFLIQDTLDTSGLFVLKEAPCADAHLAWPGFDLFCKRGDLRLAGIGLTGADVSDSEWTRGYGFVTGIAGGTEYELLAALKDYQARLRLRLPERDEMVLLNTWGDRGQDTHIGEAFALRELEAAHRLGISHFQLDDGWQAGRTLNSAAPGGTLSDLWERDGFWSVHPQRFPRGLAPVVEQARRLGVQLGLWYNPSRDRGYPNWRKDAETLIGLYRAYGIRTFKIDGVDIPDKQSDRNLRAMFDMVVEATGGDVVFNLDITAGHRWGYHCGNEYGNLFLENRYTDVGNYYPHWTLRNLWQLARYVPAQNLQIEFLNRWRNAAQYQPDDPLAPQRVPFDYCFAITMMAQPLAWFEAANLPDEAFSAAPVIKAYRRHQARIHSGRIFPIGDEPSGLGWTGFQSILDDTHGYLLVFREWNEQPQANVGLWNLAGQRVRCTPVTGHGAGFTRTAGPDGALAVALPTPFSFALWEYQVMTGAA